MDTWPCLFAIKLVELKKLGGEGAGRQAGGLEHDLLNMQYV